MSMLRYYADDSPGLKITPVRDEMSVLTPERSQFCELLISAYFPLFHILTTFLDYQVVVLLMSVCFIAFVTVLHAVAKIYQFRSS